MLKNLFLTNKMLSNSDKCRCICFDATTFVCDVVVVMLKIHQLEIKLKKIECQINNGFFCRVRLCRKKKVN